MFQALGRFCLLSHVSSCFLACSVEPCLTIIKNSLHHEMNKQKKFANNFLVLRSLLLIDSGTTRGKGFVCVLHTADLCMLLQHPSKATGITHRNILTNAQNCFHSHLGYSAFFMCQCEYTIFFYSFVKTFFCIYARSTFPSLILMTSSCQESF